MEVIALAKYIRVPQVDGRVMSPNDSRSPTPTRRRDNPPSISRLHNVCGVAPTAATFARL